MVAHPTSSSPSQSTRCNHYDLHTTRDAQASQDHIRKGVDSDLEKALDSSLLLGMNVGDVGGEATFAAAEVEDSFATRTVTANDGIIIVKTTPLVLHRSEKVLLEIDGFKVLQEILLVRVATPHTGELCGSIPPHENSIVGAYATRTLPPNIPLAGP